MFRGPTHKHTWNTNHMHNFHPGDNYGYLEYLDETCQYLPQHSASSWARFFSCTSDHLVRTTPSTPVLKIINRESILYSICPQITKLGGVNFENFVENVPTCRPCSTSPNKHPEVSTSLGALTLFQTRFIISTTSALAIDKKRVCGWKDLPEIYLSINGSFRMRNISVFEILAVKKRSHPGSIEISEF